MQVLDVGRSYGGMCHLFGKQLSDKVGRNA